jgi:hypothetical protein
MQRAMSKVQIYGSSSAWRCVCGVCEPTFWVEFGPTLRNLAGTKVAIFFQTHDTKGKKKEHRHLSSLRLGLREDLKVALLGDLNGCLVHLVTFLKTMKI